MFTLRSVLKVFLSLLLFFYSQNSFSLLDSLGNGSADDKRGLVLHYVFNENNNQDTVLNQVEKDDLTHATHLDILGKRSNVELTGSSILFKSNSHLLPFAARVVRSDIGALVGTTTVTVAKKRNWQQVQ